MNTPEQGWFFHCVLLVREFFALPYVKNKNIDRHFSCKTFFLQFNFLIFFVCILQSPMWQKGAKSYHCGWVNKNNLIINKSRKVVFSQKKALVDESSFAKPCEECSRGFKFRMTQLLLLRVEKTSNMSIFNKSSFFISFLTFFLCDY